MGGDDAVKLSSSSHSLRRSGIHFPTGSSVEVRTDDDGFEGAFFSATVISARKTSKKLFVEYRDLLAREGGSDPLREHVDPAFVRPTPPLEELVKGFEPDDVVDAFYKDAWWNGVVSRVVEGGERFVVTFEKPPDELEFGVDELRAHWEWVDGKWVKPQSKAGLMFEVGREGEVSFDGEEFWDAWFPATIQQDLGNGVFLVGYSCEKGKNMKAEVDSSLHLRPCPPLIKYKKNFTLLEKVDAFFEFVWWSGVITKELENGRYVVFFKQMKLDKEFSHSELRPPMEFKDGKWLLSSDDGMNENHDTFDNPKAPHVTKRRRCLSDSGTDLKKLKEGNDKPIKQVLCGFVSPDSCNNMETSATETTRDQSSYNSSRGMKCLRIPKRIRSKRVMRNIKRTLPRVDQEKERQSISDKIAAQVQDSLEGKMMEIDHVVEVEKVVGKVPSNEFDDDPLSKWIEEMDSLSPVGNVDRCMADGEKQRDDVVFDDEDKSSIVLNDPQILPCVNKTVVIVLDEDTEKQPESGTQACTSINKSCTVPSEPQCLPCVENAARVMVDENSEKQPKNGTLAYTLMNKSCTVPSEPQCLPCVENTVVVVVDENSEKQPENGTQACNLMNKSCSVPSEPQCLPCLESNVGVELYENSEDQPESGKQASSSLVDKGLMLPSGPRNLPFVKNPSLWKAIASMVVFQSIPQNPHFQPLEHFNEILREGLAIGYMSTFAVLVERASRLQLNDQKSIMNDIMETLVVLEEHGFDVRVVQESTTKLLGLKEKEEKLVDDVNNLNNRLLERNQENTRIEKEIWEMNEQMRELQEKISLAELEKVKGDEEIASLQARLKETEENIKDATCDFKGTVSSFLCK